MDRTLFTAAAIWCVAGASTASPYADSVVEYIPGVGADERYGDANAALGEPTRFTSPDSMYGGAVTPFNPPFGFDEIVSIGEGGSLTVQFDQPVTDDPSNPFGIDLLVFGNAFVALDGGLDVGGGVIEVSADGAAFFEVPGIDADGAYPTLGYQDLTELFPTSAGNVLTDFTRPVDPELDPIAMDILTVSAAYNRSGGGAGVDLADVGLAEISFVRISNAMGSGNTPVIDALADVSPVPEPSTAAGAAVVIALTATAVHRKRAIDRIDVAKDG